VYYASNDLDNDGIPDVFFSQLDPDIDGDGIDNFGPDGIEGNEDDDPDIDGDGILNEDEPPVRDAVYHDYTILYPSPNSEPQVGNFDGGVNIPDYIFEAENLCPIFMTGSFYHMVAIAYSSEVEMNGGDFCWSPLKNFGFGPDEDNCPETSIGCSEEGESYPIGFQLEMSDCSYSECVALDEWILVDNCEEICDTVYVEVIVPDTLYIDNFITDTIVEIVYENYYIYDTIVETEYVDVIITEYIDCDTGLPCESGISEILDKSKTDGKLYNLLGQEINRREGIYIEGGEVKYRF